MQNNQTLACDLNLPKVPGFIQEKSGKYKARKPLSEVQIIKAAQVILKRKFHKGVNLACAEAAIKYLTMKYSTYEHEVFLCIFLDNQLGLIRSVEMFRGTIDSASVYPREVVKKALELNAAAVIFAHNHPSGMREPSIGDRIITKKLQDALNMIDIRVVDHLIICGSAYFSFASEGLLD